GERMDNLFSTHPDTGNRIAALQSIAGEMVAGGMGAGRAAPPPVPPRGGGEAGPWGRAGDDGANRGPWG
ncbi:MAG TPA: protease HtpX, partial [Hyphomicrobiales bacterium]|nr:protease HtpX [Hyphomicrobiales bacterium]